MKNTKTKWIVLIAIAAIWFLTTVIYLIFHVEVSQTTTTTTNIWIERFKFFCLSLSGYGVLFSALLTSFNTMEATKNTIKANENTTASINFQKTENSFAYAVRFDSPSLKEARDITRELKRDRNAISNDELIQKIEDQGENQKNLKRSVITMFNFFEEIYLSISHKRVDEDMLKEFFVDMYCDIYDRFKCWITNEKGYMSKMQQGNLKKLYDLWQSARE
jgi:hypothetical protein